MPVTYKPVFTQVARCEVSQVSVANTNRDGATGTYVTCFTAGSNGSKLDKINVRATVTTTAGMVRLFIHNGTTARFWKEIPVAAITVSATVEGFTHELAGLDLDIPTGHTIRASTHNAEAMDLVCSGADY